MINKRMTLSDLAFFVYKGLKANDVEAVLSGGAVVSVYSKNRYESRDLDFISPNQQKDICTAMVSMGFSGLGKNFVHPNTRFTVEFPAGPLAIGNQLLPPIKETLVQGKRIKILSPTDAIKDRLAGWIYFNDPQNLEQAKIVYQSVGGNLTRIKQWLKSEGALDKYKDFIEALKIKRGN